MADQTPGGEWKWRVIFERNGGFEEVLVKRLIVNVPSFSLVDEMPVVGRNTASPAVAGFALRMVLGSSIRPDSKYRCFAG